MYIMIRHKIQMHFKISFYNAGFYPVRDAEIEKTFVSSCDGLVDGECSAKYVLFQRQKFINDISNC